MEQARITEIRRTRRLIIYRPYCSTYVCSSHERCSVDLWTPLRPRHSDAATHPPILHACLPAPGCGLPAAAPATDRWPVRPAPRKAAHTKRNSQNLSQIATPAAQDPVLPNSPVEPPPKCLRRSLISRRYGLTILPARCGLFANSGRGTDIFARLKFIEICRRKDASCRFFCCPESAAGERESARIAPTIAKREEKNEEF